MTKFICLLMVACSQVAITQIARLPQLYLTDWVGLFLFVLVEIGGLYGLSLKGRYYEE